MTAAARRPVPAAAWTATATLCILWVRGVPHLDIWTVTSPLWGLFLLGLVAVGVPWVASWLISTAALIHHKLPGRPHSRRAKERGIV